jgi:2,5-diketo-D-gluconate reductase B
MNIRIQDEVVPAIGLGTWKLRGSQCSQAVESAIRVGYRHIDTATAYGNENDIGRAMRNAGVMRRELFITTKVWPDDLRPERLRSSIETSLQELRTRYVDLALIHWPSPEVPLEDSIGELRRLCEEGKARNFGVANFSPDLFARACELGPVFSLQVECHPYLQQKRLREMARERGVLFTAYSPLAQGQLLDDPELQRIAHRRRVTPAQIALAWLIGLGGLAAIPKSADPERQRQNLEAAEIQLDDEERASIEQLDRGVRTVNPAGLAPAWDADAAASRSGA